MTITANTFLNVNVGFAPNDGLGDPLRTAFIKLNDNFNYITDFIWPNIQTTRLTTDITSTYISTFNLLQSDAIEASFVGNANTSITANVLNVNSLVITDVISNSVTANTITGILGEDNPNIAFISNLDVNDTTTSNNLIVNNSITAQTLDVTELGLSNPGQGTFNNLTVSQTLISGPGGNIGNVRWIGRTISSITTITEWANLSFIYNTLNSQYRMLILGNSTVTVTNITYPVIEPGVERILVFRNNTDSIATRYINMPNDFNNLKSNNVIVSGSGTALMHFIPFDNTEANLYVFIANT
jgi:hypothetical protein